MFVRLVLYLRFYALFTFCKFNAERDLSARGLAHSRCLNLYFIFTLQYMCLPQHGKSHSHTLPMLLGQHYPTFNTMWELRISANASPYGFLGFVINSTLNILSARGLAHSERQKNVKNVTLRTTELHNTKKAISFTTSKITFIKHPKKTFFCPVANQSSSAP